jgi:hypothetical protein
VDTSRGLSKEIDGSVTEKEYFFLVLLLERPKYKLTSLLIEQPYPELPGRAVTLVRKMQ